MTGQREDDAPVLRRSRRVGVDLDAPTKVIRGDVTQLAPAAIRPASPPTLIVNTTIVPEEIDEVTRSRPSGDTDRLAQMVTPPDIPSLREPTELMHEASLIHPPDHELDYVTRQIPSAPEPAAGSFQACDRLHQAATQIRGAVETLSVDRRRFCAQFMAGFAKGLVGEETTDAPFECMGAQIAEHLLCADAGVSAARHSDQLTKALVHMTTESFVNVEHVRRELQRLAADSESTALEYRNRAQRARDTGDTDEMIWLVRAVEREEHLAEIRRILR